MSLAGYMMTVIGLFWGVGGGIWLLRRRSYKLHQVPQFAMDLIGFPVEPAQSIWGRGGVPYALLLPNNDKYNVRTHPHDKSGSIHKITKWT